MSREEAGEGVATDDADLQPRLPRAVRWSTDTGRASVGRSPRGMVTAIVPGTSRRSVEPPFDA